MLKETVPVALNVEAVEEAKVAAATKGLSLVEYASSILLAAAHEDNDEWSKARSRGQLSGRERARRRV